MGRYCSYLLPKQDGGTSQIKVNPTKVRHQICIPVARDLSNSIYNTSNSGVKFSWSTLYSTIGGPEMKGPIYFEEYKRGSGVVPDRQEASHAHGTFFFGDNAYVTDLGGDAIWHYKVRLQL